VHLVLPEKSVFIDDKGDTKASVTVTMEPGESLTRQQVQGIGALFVGSVENLTLENLQIVDNTGKVLSDDLIFALNPDALLTQMTVEQLRLQREIERDLEKKIFDMLLPITGQKNFVAKVTAELDFNKQERSITSSDNPDNLKVSEHILRESGRTSDIGGPVGTDSNITQYPFAQDQYSTNYTREEETYNYHVSTSQETVITAQGQIKRLSVAVVVNDNTEIIIDQAKIRDAVATAIGFNYERGDQISVTSQYFDDTEERLSAAEAARAKSERDRLNLYILIAVCGFLLLLLLILLIAWLAKKLRRRREERLAAKQAELEEAQAEEERLAAIAAEEEAAAIPELEPRVPDPVESKQDILRNIANENPNNIAEVLKLWLRD
ncbi:MAG: flagellar M-ring protein FliF, partial [Peptococcaceae bacterium]|nr:flagellar M-ring protein FliF [Peptococcaceae bacterium]